MQRQGNGGESDWIKYKCDGKSISKVGMEWMIWVTNKRFREISKEN